MDRFGSPETRTLALVTVALMLAACGGGEGTPRPDGAAGTAGSGGGGSGGGSGSGSGSGGDSGSGGGTECPTPTPVSGGTVAPLETDGARLDGDTYGGWFFFHTSADEGCPTCMTNPAPADTPEVTLEAPDPERAGSSKALHWSGSGFIPNVYGAGMGIYLDNCANIAADVTGIRFSYRSDLPVKFASTQASTDYGVDLPVAEDWTEQEVAFADFMPSGFDQTKMAGMFWRVPSPASGTFSVWLDDVEWMGGSPP